MKINEIFYSLQGEGFLAGVPSVFVRVAGCPLQCRWCDTKYAWLEEAGSEYGVDKIVEVVKDHNCDFVVITGGEPMINPDLSERSDLTDLVNSLKENAKHVTIETAGVSFVPDLACDLMSISPKLSNSTPQIAEYGAIHNDSRLDTIVLNKLISNYTYQLKFVVDRKEDLLEIIETVKQIGGVDKQRVILMPQAATTDELLAKSSMVADLCKHSGFAFGQRLQILLWDNKKGT